MPGRIVQYIRSDIGQGNEVGFRVGLQRGKVSGGGPPSGSDDGESSYAEYGSPLTFLFRLWVPKSRVRTGSGSNFAPSWPVVNTSYYLKLKCAVPC